MIAHNGSVNTNRSAAVSDRFTGSSQSTSAKIRIPISTRKDTDAGVREARNEGIQTADNEARTEEARRRREELREDVVAVSEDGDTVQVSEEGSEELIESRDGSVTARDENGTSAAAAQTEGDRQEINAPEIEMAAEEEQAVNEETTGTPPPEPRAEEIRAEAEAEAEKIAAEAQEQAREITSEALEEQAAAREVSEEQATAEAAEESAQARQAQRPSTFAGVTNQQLEQMYRDGQISRYAYDSEIEAREVREEELRDENEELTTEAARLQDRQREVTGAGDEIRNATSDNASDTLTAKQRLEAIEKVEKMQDGNTEKARREEEQGRLWDYQLLT